jgi:uncharacterized protein YjbI with pentapeptide repeats
MKRSEIIELRGFLNKELKKYKGEPIKFEDKIYIELLEQIIFDTSNDGSKTFGLDIETLSKIDFTNISFNDFNLSVKNGDKPHYDFSKLTGVKINPQFIYKKDMSNAVLNGIEFIGGFNYVNIKGANFTGSKGAIIEPQTIVGMNMSKCILSGVTFNGVFDGVNIMGANFKGSDGAEINPHFVYLQSLSECILEDTFIDTKGLGFKDINVSRANFTNTVNRIKLNPQEIYMKSLWKTVLNGVEITGPIDGVYVAETDFTNSTGAVIHPITVENKSLS